MVRIPSRLPLVAALCSTLAGPLAATASSAPPALQFDTARQVPEVKGQVDLRAHGRNAGPPIANVSAQGYLGEVEPNGTTATATPIVGTNAVVKGNVFPNADVDFYSFTAAAGDRLYAAVMTSASANASSDSQLRVFLPDGTTLIEFDEDDGSVGGLSSSIANAALPVAGTYFLQVNHFSLTNQLRPYELHFRLQSGAPTAEVEANDTPATANVLPANGWVSGTRNPAAATEQDWYSFTANAGDTVFLSLDVDPERDNVQWNGRLGIALFGDAGNQILVVDDASTGSAANPLSEALFMTVKAAGTYFAFVDSASAATGGPTATYTLSVSIHPATNEGVNCTTYTSTDVPKTIGPGTGLVSSTITVPGNPRIADLDVDIVLNHALMGDVDAHLRSPAGNDNGLFTDIGAAATGGQTMMDATFDDEAGSTPIFTVLRGLQIKPELAYRLSWFDGENAGGTWTLDLRDDGANASGGTLTSWSLRICEPAPPPACAPGFAPTTVFSTDFESGAAGFTHSGTADEWQLGLPATPASGATAGTAVAAFTTCNSGVNCWKTDLTGTYNLAPTTTSVTQDLLSPNINLAGLSAPIVVTWAQRHQVENASFDHASVDMRQVGGATPVRLFEWLDATPSESVGNPAVNLGESSGWGVFSRRADSLAGLNTELLFHMDQDNSVALAGFAIDDVSVTACRAVSADLSITKTDGVTTATPGTSVTYTITASNAGGDPVTGATVADTFSSFHAGCTWTCVGAGGGTCTAAGSGNISDSSVNLPVGGSVTYSATCGVTFGATGTLTNTATVSSSVGDPVPGNNSATDTDTLTPMADLTVTKTDGVTTASPGGSVTYTIVATNTGPSNAVSSVVADTFPASLTCTWTCTGAGGTCTAAGAGNINDSVNLPAGASVTYTASCTISPSATGTLSNTATVTSATPDPTPGNNSATDSDLLAPMADLGITKTDGVTSATPGGSVIYTITASNAGPSNAPGSTVADTFAGILACTWTCVGAGGGICTAAGAGNINDTANLPAGGSVTYTANCSISPAATGTLANTATVTTGAGVSDPNSGNNSATDSDTFSPQVNLSITKSDGLVNATPGQAVTYTIVASNSGPSSAINATATDNFPAELIGASWTCAATGGGNCFGGIFIGNINASVDLPPGATVTFTVNGTIAGTFSGTLSNTATVTSGAATASATDTTQVASPAAITGIKTASGALAPGSTVTYTIVLSNSSSGAQLDNPGNELTDVLPTQLTLVTASATSGTAVATVGTNTVTWNGSIPANSSVTITIQATVNAGTQGQVVTNQATISYDADGNGTNESTRTTDDPALPGGADPTQFTVQGSVTAIPTLDGLGLAAFALALAALAAALLRKRRSA